MKICFGIFGFLFIFLRFFRFGEFIKKKRTSADWAEAQPRGPAHRPSRPRPGDLAATAARVPVGDDAAAAFPPPPRHPRSLSAARRRPSPI